jgi:hypothetical protein
VNAERGKLLLFRSVDSDMDMDSDELNGLSPELVDLASAPTCSLDMTHSTLATKTETATAAAGTTNRGAAPKSSYENSYNRQQRQECLPRAKWVLQKWYSYTSHSPPHTGSISSSGGDQKCSSSSSSSRSTCEWVNCHCDAGGMCMRLVECAI